MTKEQIAALIREEYDPKPAHWKAGEKGWDDGAERIAGAVMAEIKYLRDGLRQLADAAKDGAHQTWIVSTAEARLRGEEFIELPTGGPDWYCMHCDKMVPNTEARSGHHDEAKGGCGHALHTCKFDPVQAPKDWSKDQPPQPSD